MKENETMAIPGKYQVYVNQFLSSLDIKENTKNTYRKALKQFIDWIISSNINSPTRETILQYKRFLESKLSGLTLSTYLVVVRRFFEFLEGMKMYPNIASGIRGAKRSKGFNKDSLTAIQAGELLNKIDRTNIEGLRNYAILNLMVRTGLRTIEVIRADVKDIRQESGEAILYIHRKNHDSKDEFVLLTQKALSPINEYLSSRGSVKDDDPLFASCGDRNFGQRLTTCTISVIAKKQLRAINLNSHRLTAHSLRHTACTLTLKAGATLQEVQAMAGHSDINTTLIYAHNINRIENAPERRLDNVF